MKILAIETSCDETAIAIVEAIGDEKAAEFKVLGNALLSQIDIHKEYGGVFPALAKREHAKNLVPLLDAALEEAELLREDAQALSEETHEEIAKLLEREPGLAEQFFDFITECEVPNIDAIAVTAGPGLEPALWVGVNFAKALSLVWEKPIVAVNHMEGHIMAALAESADDTLTIKDVSMPVLALLISGGHTELVLMKEWLSYELIGQTRDDAVGEAFDKVARMLGLPYPGGPEISKLAESARRGDADLRRLGTETQNPEHRSQVDFSDRVHAQGAKSDLTAVREHANTTFNLPRPMLHDSTCDFSFSGLKTAVLYLLKDRPDLSEPEQQRLAREFEDTVAEVLWKKTLRALDQTGAATLVLGGGVSANTHIRRTFRENIDSERPDVSLRIPTATLTTDNAIMIALAGFYRASREDFADPADLAAKGNRRLA